VGGTSKSDYASAITILQVNNLLNFIEVSDSPAERAEFITASRPPNSHAVGFAHLPSKGLLLPRILHRDYRPLWFFFPRI